MARRLRLTVPRVNATVIVAGLVVTTLGTGATALTAVAMSHPHHHLVAAVKPVASPTAAASPIARPAPLTPATSSVLAAPLPRVTAIPRPKHLVNATLLVTGRHALTHKQLKALRKLSGVKKTETVASGTAKVDGHRAFVLGVDPATFRPWTPKLTAKSNALWQSIGRGELTADFDMGNQAKLPLGKTVAVKRPGDTAAPLRIGAFASIGMSDVDAVVDKADASKVGLVRHSGIVLSAPKADPLVLRKAALAIAGRHARAQLLREVIITRDAGEFLTRKQISDFLHTAASRIGMPYVWGAEGPKSFDCSGLVQWSFGRIGIRMPRVAAQQWFAGPHIAYKDARPGDLLFWHYDPTDPTDIDHVAIYAGNGMMIVAPHTGLNVQYVPVPTADMAGVVRVDPALAAQIA